MIEQTPVTNDASPHQGQSALIMEGRSVEADHGWQWIREGYFLFMKAPFMWIAITFLMLVIIIVLSFIPILGQIAVNLLMPVLGGGLMLGCQSLSSGGALEINHLFEGFKQNTSKLALIAVFYLLGLIVITLIFVAIAGGSVMTGAVMGRGGVSASVALGAMIGMLVAVALSMPLAMATWFAIPLVVFHNVAPLDAMKASFFACVKNVVPFLVFGLICFVLTMLAIIPLLLGFLVLVPVFVSSVYVGYRDIFFAKE